MRTIVHLSDLHFGAINAHTIGALIEAVGALRPDVVAVSGDLTQRARVREFTRARAFLAELPSPQIVVPGNHDVPLHNVVARFWFQLSRYRRYITPDLEPFLMVGDDLAIAGLNTARSWTFKGGRVNEEQVTHVCERLSAAPADAARIVVAHHPFDLPQGVGDRLLVGRAHLAMELFARSRTDVFLTGHLHASRISQTGERYRIPGHSALVLQAGTATSSRERLEANAFNVLRIDRSQAVIEHFVWSSAGTAGAGAFKMLRQARFTRDDGGWRAAKPE
jgi:3',5'-cyclic AMP phosphodiesterase CpdA